MSRAIRAIAAGVALVMVAAGASPTAAVAAPGTARSATGLAADLSTPMEAPPAGADDVIAAFEAAGVHVTPIDAPVAGDGMTLTDWQAGNLARQAAAGAGLSGAQLRAAFPVADDGVPVDAIVAAWLISGETASAAAARSVMAVDVETISDPATATYPWAVLVLFAHDLVSSSPSVPGSEPAGWQRVLTAADPDAPMSGTGVCGALSDFYTAVRTAIIAALADVPVLGTLAELAIQLFEEVLGTAVQALLLPVQLAITALGVAAIVAQVVDPWVFHIDKEPLLVIDYGISPNPGNPGSFSARIGGGAILEWPSAVQACAALAGVQLPDLDPNGATVTWTTGFGAHATVTSQDGTIADDGGDFVATLAYTTAVETPEAAEGELTSATISVSVKVTRPEDQQLGAIVEQIVGNALSGLPGPIAEILASLAGSAIGSVVQFNDPTGSASITVQFHIPPPPETTVPETPPPTTPPSCVGRVLAGQAQLQGTTLELRADGTWVVDFAGYPPQTVEGAVTVVLEGQLIGTWTPTEDGAGFVITPSPDSPFSATGTYGDMTITMSLDDVAGMLEALFGLSSSGGGGAALCTNGAVTTTDGNILFA